MNPKGGEENGKENVCGAAAVYRQNARAMGKDPHYVRLAIQQGVVKFGVAMKVGDASEFSYYCPDRKVWEETGYFRDVTKEKAHA